MNTKSLLPLAAVAASVALPSMGLAQDATVATGEPALHTSYILTTLLFLMGGFLVF